METLKIITLAFGLGLAFGACKNPAESEATTELPSALFKEWRNSYEEDRSDGISIYRPAEFDFPPSRGRTGLTIERDGKFVAGTIAPACGIEYHTGHWKAVGRNLLEVSFAGVQSYKIKIVFVSQDVLKIKSLP